MKTCPKCGATFRTKHELQKEIDAAVVELVELCNQEPQNRIAIKALVTKLNLLSEEWKEHTV